MGARMSRQPTSTRETTPVTHDAPAARADNLPECGEDCFFIDYDKKPAVATTWHNNRAGDTDEYPMPDENSGIYNQGTFPQMRDAFAEAARKEQAKYRSYAKGCSGRCICQKDKDARSKESTPWSVPVT